MKVSSFHDIQVVIVMNFVVVSSVGMKRVDCIIKCYVQSKTFLSNPVMKIRSKCFTTIIALDKRGVQINIFFNIISA